MKAELAERLLLRPREVADMLGISRSKIYELIATGELPGITVAGCIRVSAAAFRAWLDAQQVASGDGGFHDRRTLSTDDRRDLGTHDEQQPRAARGRGQGKGSGPLRARAFQRKGVHQR